MTGAFLCGLWHVLPLSVLILGIMASFHSSKTSVSYQVNMSSSCPRGWTRFYRHCFVYIPRAMSWAHGERNCFSMGVHLASVHSSSEYLLIQKLTGTDASGENIWLWNDGSHFRYTHWRPGEPSNGYGKQHCLQINYSASKCWDDLECAISQASICVTSLVLRHIHIQQS
uniref:C-type lectin domain-containing protein n=1 Tax=Neolamprologus brichardi TaxID=32507 RepID=A0A3Q4G9L6_NEOBR